MKFGNIGAGLAGAVACALALGAASAAAQQVGVSNAYLEGKWKDNVLCLGKPQFLFDANRSVMIDDSILADYAVSGLNQVTMSGQGGSFTISASPVDADTMYVSDGQGSAGEMYRCSPTPQAAKRMTYAPQAVAPTPASPAAGVLAPAFLYGRWTTTNCSKVGTFRQDGTFLDSTGAVVNWVLGGNYLTFTVPSAGVSDTVTVRAIDANTLERTESNGSRTVMRRCP